MLLFYYYYLSFFLLPQSIELHEKFLLKSTDMFTPNMSLSLKTISTHCQLALGGGLDLGPSQGHFLSRCIVMFFTASMVSVQVGWISISGSKNPKCPVSRSSKANV